MVDSSESRFNSPQVAARIANEMDHIQRLGVAGFTHAQQKDQPSFPMSYAHLGMPPAIEKLKTMEYLRAVTGTPFTPSISMAVTDEDVKQLKEKENIVLQTEFDSWFAQSFDLAAPAEKEMMKKVYPEYFDNMLKYNHETHKLQEDLARISIKGIESFDDLMKAFAIAKSEPLNRRAGQDSAPHTGQEFGPMVSSDEYSAGFLNRAGLVDSSARMGLVIGRRYPRTNDIISNMKGNADDVFAGGPESSWYQALGFGRQYKPSGTPKWSDVATEQETGQGSSSKGASPSGKLVTKM